MGLSGVLNGLGLNEFGREGRSASPGDNIGETALGESILRE